MWINIDVRYTIARKIMAQNHYLNEYNKLK